MRKLSLTIIFLCFSVNASAQPFGGSFNPEGPSSTYQIFTNTNKFVGILDASDITVQQALEDLSFIVASPTTVTSEWNFANGNLVLPQGTTCPNAGTCTDGAICYDTNATSGQRVYACESGTWTLQGDGGAGGGDSITINSTAASDAQFTESLPSVPASGLGVKWQIDTSTSPDSVSAYAAVNTSSVLAGVLSDETGSGGGVVFATSPTITSPTISTSIALPASAVDAITEIASALKSGADTTLVTGTAGGSGNCAQWNVDGDIVDSGAGCGGGSGDNILINGSAVTDANFNESNPSTPASGLSVKWQTTGSSATQITGYAAVSTSAILAGAISDETGTGAVVLGTSPTFTTKIIYPNSADDDVLGAAGESAFNTTDEQLSFHSAADGEISGEASISLIRHLTATFDPAGWYDQESTYRVVPLMTVGDDSPEGITITEWEVDYVGGNPTTELDADIICDTTPDYNPAAGATVMDVIDTTTGASSADTGFDSATCANASKIYIRFGADPTDANVVIQFDLWFYNEED